MKQPKPVAFHHTPAAPTVQKSAMVQWEFQTLNGGEQARMAPLGLQGWEAYAVVQMPGALKIYMKRRIEG